MKRLKEITTMLFAVGLFAACDSEGGSDVIWDIAPVEFNIFITDSEGHDLLDSTFQNNLIKEITVSYQGETYPVTTEREYYEELYSDIQTRAYMPHFYGLMLHHLGSRKTSNYGDFELTFGEFDGVENIDRREITLNMPDGHQATLSYKNDFKWKSNGDPKKSTVFYLDGQELKDDAGKCGAYYFQYSNSQGLKYIASDIK
ncbi:MAG: hypothetical protein II822_00445 [Prevotella sp.]|nr:hypothetical protein [Prevotella sp.]